MILQCQDIIIIWLRLNNDWKNLNTPEKEQGKDKKKIAYHDAIKLYNTLLSIYFNDYNNISDEKKKKENMGEKHNPNNLLIKGYRFLESRKKDNVSHSQKKLLLKERN